MEVKPAFENFSRALGRLVESYERAKSSKDDYVFFRDSTIQRFEFTVEAFWKFLKLFLKEFEGKICNSPKSCIKEMFNSGFWDEGTTRKLLLMIDDRNMTSHTYHEEIAEIIFARIPEYIDLILKSKEKLEFKLQEDL